MTTQMDILPDFDLLTPTLDLHCHLRGTIPPTLAAKLAREHDIQLPNAATGNEYSFSGFDDFLSLYDQVGHVIRTAGDLRDVAYQYIETISLGGTLYVEFMISPGHSVANGIPFDSQVSAISDAIEQAECELGVYGCIVVTCVRHRGPEEAIVIAELVASQKSRYVRGFGLTGNENLFAIDEFKGAFMVAEGAGLGLTAHAGEWSPAVTVLEAVNSLNLSRVGHGISVATNPDIMTELVERKIGFEVCLSSNVHLGASRSFEEHPARKMLDAGCSITFSTDDPAYFKTTPQQEMQLAISHLEVTAYEQRKCFDDGVEMAFCDDQTKSKILSIW